jgi:hypothetical protein
MPHPREVLETFTPQVAQARRLRSEAFKRGWEAYLKRLLVAPINPYDYYTEEMEWRAYAIGYKESKAFDEGTGSMQDWSFLLQ